MEFQNGKLHFNPCWNCEIEVYICPGTSHPHQEKCDICEKTYWACPTKSDAGQHRELICEPSDLRKLRVLQREQREILDIPDR